MYSLNTLCIWFYRATTPLTCLHSIAVTKQFLCVFIHIYIYSFTFISVLQCFKQQYSVLIKYNFYLLYNGIFFCLFIHRIHHVVVYCSGIVVFIMQKLWKSFLDMSFFPPVFYIYFALLKSCLH